MLVALTLGGWVGAAAQPTLDAERLDAALAGSAVRYAESIRAFYTARAELPFWTDGTGLSEDGVALHTALLQAYTDGFAPLDYAVLDVAEHHPREATEVAFSDALLRFADDLARGRVDPARVHRDWDAKPRPFDAEQVLRLADSLGSEAALQAARPPHEAYARLRDALARYCALADADGWPTIPPGPVLRLGDENPAVLTLRERLRLTGDLDTDDPGHAQPTVPDERYDAVMEEAVRRVQARHGLDVDGAVGPATRAVLNVSAAARAQQIAVNMERWRWLPADLGPTHLLINAAGMWLELVEDSERALRLRTVVGTLDNPTPGFSSLVTHAVFSPYWNVPESIARTEIRPRLARDPGYLARNHMRVLANGRIRQDPGPDNPLGPVKFIFRNRFGVRLHGTSAPALFDERVRAFSHGCIRVEDPLRLAIRLVRNAEWDASRVRFAVDRGDENWVRLAEPVPLHVAYWTAWVEDDGTVQFRDDLYGRDRALLRTLMASGYAGIGVSGGFYDVDVARVDGSATASIRDRARTTPEALVCATPSLGVR